MPRIDIKGLDRASVLQALYDRAKSQGLGAFQYTPGPLSHKDAVDMLKHQTHFDYVRGRVMKVDLSQDSFDPILYDRDNGEGAASDIISVLKGL